MLAACILYGYLDSFGQLSELWINLRRLGKTLEWSSPFLILLFWIRWSQFLRGCSAASVSMEQCLMRFGWDRLNLFSEFTDALSLQSNYRADYWWIYTGFVIFTLCGRCFQCWLIYSMVWTCCWCCPSFLCAPLALYGGVVERFRSLDVVQFLWSGGTPLGVSLTWRCYYWRRGCVSFKSWGAPRALVVI